MTYRDFEKDQVADVLKDAFISTLFESVMKTRQSHNFHDHFDFSHNRNVCFSSDYGGENDQSKYNVYTFTFFSFKTLETWRDELNALRASMGYNKPAEYKSIAPETREGKLRDWLKTTERSFKGMVFSVAVDKQIDSLFAPTVEELHKAVCAEPHYRGCPLIAKVLEKSFRIAYFSNMVLSQILGDGYGYMWMTDRDAITQGQARWDFTVTVHDNILRLFCAHLSDVKKGYATPFKEADEDKHFSEDFLSISDLISGSIDDYTNYMDGKSPGDLLKALKPKSIEILSYLKKLPTYIYVMEKSVSGVDCKRVLIDVVE